LIRRKIVIPVLLILLAISGFAGYGTWQEYNQNQVSIDNENLPACSHCSIVKRDLAEKVRRNEQQSKQNN
jgi:hypothetical protein